MTRALAVLVLAGVLAAPPAPSRVGATPKSIENPASLIYAGWFGNTIPTPSFVSSNITFLESQPFDGLVVYLRNANLSVNLTTGVMKPVALSYDTMMSVLAPMASLDFTNLKENLGLIQGSTPPDFFDDWSVVIQNYANIAKAAKDSGLKGLCFDNEQYHAPWGNYGSLTKYYSSKTLAEYGTQARLRGKQVMEAMVAEFPNIVFMTLHGPYISEPDAPAALQFPQWQSSNELLGPFFAGHVEGAGSTGCSMDGGELYTLRTADDFRTSYSWRRNDLPSDAVDCSYIPSSLRSVWPGRSSISFGVYDVAFGGASMNATILRSTLANSLRQADRYVWFYAEAATYLLPSNGGGASATWVDAIRQAKADVAATAGSAPPTADCRRLAVRHRPRLEDTWIETGYQIERKMVINDVGASRRLMRTRRTFATARSGRARRTFIGSAPRAPWAPRPGAPKRRPRPSWSASLRRRLRISPPSRRLRSTSTSRGRTIPRTRRHSKSTAAPSSMACGRSSRPWSRGRPLSATGRSGRARDMSIGSAP
jgi:hypothetical protein